VLGYVLVIGFCLANARAARIVGERWGIDTAVALPRIGWIIAVDAVIVIAYGVVSGSWAALALLPLVATVLLVALRWRGGSRALGVGGRPQSPAA
jgi:hypothetical protein